MPQTDWGTSWATFDLCPDCGSVVPAHQILSKRAEEEGGGRGRLRDQFAMAALPGLVEVSALLVRSDQDSLTRESPEDLAYYSYLLADAMLKAREGSGHPYGSDEVAEQVKK